MLTKFVKTSCLSRSIRGFSTIQLKNNGFLVDSYDKLWNLEASHDSYIVDMEGNEYLDFHGGYGSNPIGWNHPDLINLMSPYKHNNHVYANKPANGDFYTEELSDFVDRMKSLIPKEYPYIFFIDGGALAVENALKVAMDWKVQRTGNEDATQILHFEKAFHGRSGYTMSLTNTDPHKVKYFPKFDWPRIYEVDEVESLISERGAENIAALIFEPIRCEGGDIHFTQEELKHLEHVCVDNDILLIADEVQTGFGASGLPFAFQHFDIKPDIVTFGKKSQQCGIFGGHRVREVEENCFVNSGRISSTWSGNLVDMVRGTSIIDIIESDSLIDNAAIQGQRWNRLMSATPTQLVDNVRNLGLLMAFDCPSTEIRDEVVSKMYDNGLLALSCGDRTVRFRPNLAVNKDHIDLGVDITLRSVNEVSKKFD